MKAYEAFEMLMNGKVKDDEIYNFLTFYQQKVRFLKKLQGVSVLRDKSNRVNVENCMILVVQVVMEKIL